MSMSDIRNISSPSFYGTLARSSTAGRIPHSQRAFGEKTYMNKDDYEKERTKWLAKLDDIEARLADSETMNSDMHQIKAELNKKIVEMEKNQKPLIEQNRRITERNKVLQQEVKRVERKLCHSRDDFLTLKDQHDRVVKENAALKERRVYPEKLEELERYKNQVLEYSKCITALRTAGAEKDRRYEYLVQKFKRLRKCLKKGDTEDDSRSTVSEWSGDSMLSLDPITEDFEEALITDYRAQFKENSEIQKTLNDIKFVSPEQNEEAALREQVANLQSTIFHQQTVIEANQEMISQSAQLKAVVAAQQEKIKSLEGELEQLRQEVVASKDANELLEFQVLEMEEQSKSENSSPVPSKSVHDKGLDTDDIELDDGSEETSSSKKDFTKEDISSLKKNFNDLRTSRHLRLAERRTVGDAQQYLNVLEAKLNTVVAESEKKDLDYQNSLRKLQTEICGARAIQMKKEEVQMEIIALRKTLQEMDSIKLTMSNEMKTLSRELNKIRIQLNNKDAELDKERKLAEGLNKQLQVLVVSCQQERDSTSDRQKQLEDTTRELAEVKTAMETLQREKDEIVTKHAALVDEFEKFKHEQRPSIRTELERRYEETKYRLNCAIEKIHKYELILAAASSKEEGGKLSETLQENVIQLREYNEHLERQFKAQTEIIDAMKERLIKHKRFCDFISKLTNSVNSDTLADQLQGFAQDLDKDSAKLIHNILYIVKNCAKPEEFTTLSSLEISTAHQKLRPRSPADSSGGWHSNSSDGILSADEGHSPAEVV